MAILKKSRLSRLRPAILAIAMIFALVAGSLPAIAQTEAAAGPINVTITDSDYEGMPETVAAGLVSLTFANQGQKDHMADILKLNPGVSLEQLQAAMSAGTSDDGAAFFSLITSMGGMTPLAPGKSATVAARFDAGNYLIIDFDGAENGLIQPFEVMGTAASDEQPQADFDVMMHEFVFGLPASVEPGTKTLKVTNHGDQDHEMILVSIGDHTLTDVEAALGDSETPSWVVLSGGIGPITPGATAWLTLDLAPGNYAAVCMIPDANTGMPHALLGMASVFTVE